MSRLLLSVFVLCSILITSASALADEASDKAVEFVEKLGGEVTRNEGERGGPVIAIDLSGTETTDGGLKELAALKSLKMLDLSRTEVTDAGLKELAQFEKLTTLRLQGAKVTDAGMKHLAVLKNLTFLDLVRTGVTDAGLKELTSLRKLSVFHAKGSGITKEGLDEFRKELPSLALVSATASTGAAPIVPQVPRVREAPQPQLAGPVVELPPPLKPPGRITEDDAKALFARDLKNIESMVTVGTRGGTANKSKASRAIKSNAMMIAFWANSRIGAKPADDVKLQALRDGAIAVALAGGRKNFNIGVQIKQLNFDMKAAPKADVKALPTVGLVKAGEIELEELMYQFKKTSVGGLGIEEAIKANAKNTTMPPGEALLLARRVLAVSEICEETVPTFDVKKTRADWDKLNKNMNYAAQDLIATAKDVPKKMSAAFAKLDKACVECHERFK